MDKATRGEIPQVSILFASEGKAGEFLFGTSLGLLDILLLPLAPLPLAPLLLLPGGAGHLVLLLLLGRQGLPPGQAGLLEGAGDN